jgi:hypothetical protein
MHLSRKKIIKFLRIILLIFIGSLAAFRETRARIRVEDEAMEREEWQEQADLDFLMDRKHK